MTAARSRYLVVFEKGAHSWGAHVPDLPGCVAAGESRDEVRDLIRDAIKLHIEGMRAAGEAVPPPASQGAVVEVPEG